MGIQFAPKPGQILRCDFSEGFQPPEMVKARPVIVLSPPMKARQGLETVVCLSTTRPDPKMPYHCVVDVPSHAPQHLTKKTNWLKGDMLYSVRFERLDLYRFPKKRQGKRQYFLSTLSDADMRQVRCCVLHGLGLSTLTTHVK